MSFMEHVREEVAGAGLCIWLLGEFRVAVAGELVPTSAWRRSKARSVVKLLSLAPGHRLHREQLMEHLWSDLDPEAAGANLRNALHFARGALGPSAVRVNNEIVRLDAAALWVDVDAFEHAARHGDVAAALDLYTDDLLLEDRFEPWCEGRRQQLRSQACQLLLERSRELERDGAHRDAAAALERLLVLDPLSEAGHCSLMRLHALAGRRHAALQLYRQLEDRLSTDLGVSPSDEALRLRDEILAGELSADDQTSEAPAAAEAQSVRLDEERKLVTVVVVELGNGQSNAGDGGDAKAPSPSPERIRGDLDAAAARAEEILLRWGGQSERQVGGVVVAVFGAPSAGERDVEHALRAALEVVAQAAGPVRIGVDTGLIVAPTGLAGGLRRIAGEPLATANRLHELADAGAIVASERTCRAARDGFVFGERKRLLSAPGTAPLDAHRVVAVRPSGASVTPVLPMIGRDAQLDAVLGVFAGVAGEGRPHLLTIVGNAGVGKSRLVVEVLAAVATRWPGTAVRRGRCVSFGDGVTYWALGEILRETCGIEIGEPTATVRTRLQERLGVLLQPLRLPDRDVKITIAALAATAGIDVGEGSLGQFRPEAVADELGRAWSRFAAALASTRPAILVIEDAHWADDQLLDTLERMVGRVQAPLLVLATARTELLETHPRFGARSQAASVISLPPLPASAGRELFDGLAAAQGLDDS